ncbi:O-antigen ligase family protein [Flavobacterium sp. XGLA_31]|uniref:O-antigen ligase family protein n=1 Tax=Flavobacterium sp. XGLA_31 TaxID=3447666 RepID=UPI003F390D61
MGNIYNSLKHVFQNLIKENTDNRSFIPALLVLASVPLSYAVNNIALALFVLVSIFTLKKSAVSFQNHLVLPILLFGLMTASYFWSIDPPSTSSAILKEISLLLIPFCFFLFKDFSKKQKQKIIQYYSYSMVLLVIYYSLRAIVRFFILHDSRVFFYHGENEDDYGLVPKLLNAIHVSVFVAIAFFYFLTKEIKTKWDSILASLLFLFILLLSSKNMILTVLLLLFVYIFFFSKMAHKMRLKNLIVFGLLVVILFSTGKIKQRFQAEFRDNTAKSISANVIDGVPQGVHYVSIREAWTNPLFTPNDYFPGTAFRVYQFRIFTEIIQENNAFFTGFGLNASLPKIKEKAIQYHLFMGNENAEGYQTKNFHNQYVQNFAELGILGFLILLIMLFINVKNAYKTKDFVHFAFAILMISLFLTESFLWRQRGVVFFTMLYCLFNSGIVNHSKAK